jgi:hypothetical protein
MTYPVKLTLFALVVSLLVFCWNLFIPIEYTSNDAYFVVSYFYLFSFATHFLLVKSMNDENKNLFTFRYMGISGIKLFLSLIIIFIYAFSNKSRVIPFAILFLLIYFLFTGFEIASLLKRLKKK